MSQITDQNILDNSKDLPVPDFNKKEIEGIAVESVKKEIAAGNIPTGTKLYKHTVTLKKNASPYNFVIINSKKSSYSDINDVYDDLNKSINQAFEIAYVVGPGFYASFRNLVKSGSTYYINQLYFSSSNQVSNSQTEVTTVSLDTVIEL